MEYRINDIIKFQHNGLELFGVIKLISDNVYYVKGNNTKDYTLNKNDIVESVGRSRTNEARAKAEQWEKEKRPLFNRPKYD